MFRIAKENVQNESQSVKKEIAWLFANALETTNSNQIKYIFDLRVFECLCELLKSSDASKVDIILLRSLQKLADYDYENNERKLALFIWNEKETCAAYNQIEELLNNKDPNICEAAQELINVLTEN